MGGWEEGPGGRGYTIHMVDSDAEISASLNTSAKLNLGDTSFE